MALFVIALLVVLGLAVVKIVNTLIRNRANPMSSIARPGVRLGTALAAGIVAFLLGYFLLVGGLVSSTRSIPVFSSLQSHPDASLKGTVAYNALPIASQGKKLGCVDIVSASGGPSRRLFCASQPMEMGAALTWLADGRLRATNRGQDHWCKIVDAHSGAIQEVSWVRPPAPTTVLATGPTGEKVALSTSDGTLRLTLKSGSTNRVLLSIAVPPNYSMSNLAWSPDGKWFVVEDSAGRLLSITTGASPVTRLLLDGGTEPAVTDIAY